MKMNALVGVLVGPTLAFGWQTAMAASAAELSP